MAKHMKQIAEELGIDVPIMSSKVVGNRVELYLYGGQVLNYPPVDDKKVPAVDLQTMTVGELREIAKIAEVPGYSKMKKAQLIKALTS